VVLDVFEAEELVEADGAFRTVRSIRSPKSSPANLVAAERAVHSS